MSLPLSGCSMIGLFLLSVLMPISLSVPTYTDIDPQYYVEEEEVPAYSQPTSLQSILNEHERFHDTSELKSASKRALSILTRWRNLGGGIGRRTNSLSKVPRAPMLIMQGDLEEAQDNRKVGAPLRWGRRR